MLLGLPLGVADPEVEVAASEEATAAAVRLNRRRPNPNSSQLENGRAVAFAKVLPTISSPRRSQPEPAELGLSFLWSSPPSSDGWQQQASEDCWCYLAAKRITVALLCKNSNS